MEILTTNVYCVEHGKESAGWIFLLLLHSVRKFHVISPSRSGSESVSLSP